LRSFFILTIHITIPEKKTSVAFFLSLPGFFGLTRRFDQEGIRKEAKVYEK